MALISGAAVDPFWMDATDVTNAQFARFLQATRYVTPTRPRGRDSAPVVGVAREDAEAYARWARKRLPTEAEWALAARGGHTGARYPWSNDGDGAETNQHGFRCARDASAVGMEAALAHP
jgi:formylglycine-generating enzyme required for sulfatase activity